MRKLVLLAMLGALAPSPSALAQPSGEGELSRRARAIERETMSPFCPGKTLYDCPSPRAAEWRADIRSWLRDGYDARTIRARLQERAPDVELGGSDPGGAAALAVLLASLLVLLLVAARVRARGRRDDEPAPAESEARSALDDRLDAELDAQRWP